MRSWILGMVTGTLDYLKLKERGQAALEFAKERPIAATLIGVAAATSFLPAVVFVSFVATFLAVGLITLLVIEGIAILSAVGVLIFALVSSMFASVFIGLFLISGMVLGRFAWRVSAPIRAKMAARLGLKIKGDCGAVDSKNSPEEKPYGQTIEGEEEEYVVQE